MNVIPIDSASFEADRLIREYPPQLHNGNKRLVYEISRSSGCVFEGQITYRRWPAQELPERVLSPSPFSVCPGVFAYAAPQEPNVVDWHLNFADPQLFFAYGSSLLAQDELQVAEHPALGSIREALLSRNMETTTVDRRGNPTPVTISGVQRMCVIDTLANSVVGCPKGLYGNAFARATEEQIRIATRPISPPTISNILAIAAPLGGHGAYSRMEMLNVLITAYTGFLGARAESVRLVQEVSRIAIHTGFWGCGAFGGNRRLMTILQCLAADLAGVELVFWAFDESGVKLATDARHKYEQLRKNNPTVENLLDRLVEEKFRWGVSDGN